MTKKKYFLKGTNAWILNEGSILQGQHFQWNGDKDYTVPL